MALAYTGYSLCKELQITVNGHSITESVLWAIPNTAFGEITDYQFRLLSIEQANQRYQAHRSYLLVKYPWLTLDGLNQPIRYTPDKCNNAGIVVYQNAMELQSTSEDWSGNLLKYDTMTGKLNLGVRYRYTADVFTEEGDNRDFAIMMVWVRDDWDGQLDEGWGALWHVGEYGEGYRTIVFDFELEPAEEDGFPRLELMVLTGSRLVKMKKVKIEMVVS